MKIILASLYANPIHPGHIEYLYMSKNLGDKLIVIVNNDLQQKLKIGKVYQDQNFRLNIIKSIKPVDKVFLSIDEDPSVCKSIEAIYNDQKYYHPEAEIIFAKGGDRFIGNIPEVEVCNRLGINIVDGLGEKIHSSTEYR